jgi:putative acetyltransferase
MFSIRPEGPEDAEAIRRLHDAAFGGPDEARIVDSLRAAGLAMLSLVAVENRVDVVGHVLFSPMTHDGPSNLRVAAMAPVGVDPARQRRGIGSAVIREGLEMLRDSGVDVVCVLGDPAFYRRFGFEVSERLGITPADDVPAWAFQALALRPGIDVAGLNVRHAPQIFA